MRSMLQICNVVGLFALIPLFGCATTQQADTAKRSGFLIDYSSLKPGKGDEALLTYRNPRANWSRYKKVLIDPVAIYTAPNAELRSDSREEQAALATYFAAALRQELGKHFTIVTTRGPDVLRIRTALTDADQSEVLLDTVSTVMPIGLALSTLKRATTGSDSAVGFAQAEAEVVDAQTFTRLAAAVDKRYGTKALRSKFGSWNHAKEAMDYWAAQLASRLVELGAGKK